MAGFLPVAESETATNGVLLYPFAGRLDILGRLSIRGSLRCNRNRHNAIRSDRTAIRSFSFSDQILKITALIHKARTFHRKRSGAAGSWQDRGCGGNLAESK